MSIRFAVIGLYHNHMYSLTQQLLAAGAHITQVYEADDALLHPFIKTFPQAQRTGTIESILHDAQVQLVISAPLPDQRAGLGIKVMQAGKDYLTDKPGFTTLAQLDAVQRVQAETKKMYIVYFSERLASPATVKAGELIQQGAIGQVIQTVGFGPHTLNAAQRPAWFFKRQHVGGILNDLACHQIDQFLYLTGAAQAELVQSQVGNFNHPHYPELDDFGDVLLRSAQASGYARVDWFTPGGLDTWGDVRLFILGTEGTIEVRKNIDLQGKAGGNHLFIFDQHSTRYINCAGVPTPFGEQIVADVLNRTETAMTQAHCFLASRLALQAQAAAQRLTQAPAAHS